MGKGEKIGVGEKKKNSACDASREVVWGGERVAQPGDMSLMPPIRPPAINLSLKCQHVKFSSRMSAWANYAALVKKHLNSRWSNSVSKEIYLTSIANWSNTSLGKVKYRRFREKAPCSTEEEESNRFSRRSHKFAVRVIMLVDIASYNVRDEKLLLVEFIFRGGKMCEFSTLGDRLFSLNSCWICSPIYKVSMSSQNRVKISNNHFPWVFSTRFYLCTSLRAEVSLRLACMAFSVYEVVHVACQFRIWFVKYATDKRGGLRKR